MKSYRRFLAAAAAVMLLCILLTVSGTAQAGMQRRDMLLLNDIAETVRENLSSPEQLEGRFDTELLVFRSGGARIYASAGVPDSLRTESDAVREGWLCIALTDEGNYLGSVAVPDPAAAQFLQMRRQIILTVAVICGILFLLLTGIGLYLRQRIVQPFQRMNRFAERIAQGDLDDPLLMEQGNLFGRFTEGFDIMREALRESRMREEALRQRERELAASLGHDIKTPVTGIKVICELLNVKTEDEYTRRKLCQISEKAEQIHILADDLLHASLEELGEMQVHCTNVPSAVLDTLIPEHDPRGLVRMQNAPECLIFIDQGRLSQVIGNIISNSYKYADTPIGLAYAFSGDYLTLAVSDHGGGVPEEELPQITAKYYRGQQNASGRDGSGLGLYIAEQLMQRMGGGLRCENRGGGLTVTLLIPLTQ